MSKKTQLQAEIVKLQNKIALLNTVPEDTFPFGTIVVFQTASGSKWHYVKKGEEAWENVKGNNNTQQSLAEWILDAKDSDVGYFEVYVLITQPNPFFASA